MLRDDETDAWHRLPGLSPDVFHGWPALTIHLAEHEGPKKCRQCGETVRGSFHRCR